MKVALALLAGIFLVCICHATAESNSLKKVIGDRLHEIVKRQARRGLRRGNRFRYYNYNYSGDDDRYDDDLYDDDRYDDRYDDDRYDDDDGGRFGRFNRFNRRRGRRF